MSEGCPARMPRTTQSRVEALLQQSRALLELLASAGALPELLAGLVPLIEEQSSDGLVATVLLADADGTHLRHGAAPRMPSWYNEAIDGIEVGAGVGSCGTAAFRRQPVVVVDVLVDPLWADFRDLAEKAGFRACWSLPLISAGDDLLGTFAMYYPEPRTPSDEDLQTGVAFARTAALAIQRSRDEQARNAAVEAEAQYARRLSRLAEASLELASAETLDELVEIVIGNGIRALDAAGGAVCVRDDESESLHLTLSSELGADAQVEFGHLRLDSAWPAAYVARTGTAVLLPDRASQVAHSPEMAALHEAIPCAAWAILPLRVQHRLLGSLAVAWSQERTFSDSDLELLGALAAQCAQSLDRIATRAAQRDAAMASQRLSEALQRSLLTSPPHHEHLAVAVRYLAAVEQAQIGGDWYDMFSTDNGVTNLVIGDVNGHDRVAAAAMGQVRNLLRGLAFDSVDPPAALLSRLDAAIDGLGLGVLATVVLAQAVPASDPGALEVRWSNAGHPPPLVRRADGTVDILSGKPDLLLGLAPETGRHDSATTLSPGSTLLLYTDGLVERRAEDLDQSIARLATVLAEVGDAPLEQVCNTLIARLLPDGGEDDVALLVVRPRPIRTAVPTPHSGPMHTGHLDLAADPRSVAAARHLVTEVARSAGLDPDLLDSAVLLTSELVTNSVVHAGSAARVTVLATGAGVRIEVSDGSETMPERVEADTDATAGRGVALVSLLATRWHAQPRPGGKTVWFEIGDPHPASPVDPGTGARL